MPYDVAERLVARFVWRPLCQIPRQNGGRKWGLGGEMDGLLGILAMKMGISNRIALPCLRAPFVLRPRRARNATAVGYGRSAGCAVVMMWVLPYGLVRKKRRDDGGFGRLCFNTGE